MNMKDRPYSYDRIETSDDSNVAYVNGQPLYLPDDVSCLNAEEKRAFIIEENKRFGY